MHINWFEDANIKCCFLDNKIRSEMNESAKQMNQHSIESLTLKVQSPFQKSRIFVYVNSVTLKFNF